MELMVQKEENGEYPGIVKPYNAVCHLAILLKTNCSSRLEIFKRFYRAQWGIPNLRHYEEPKFYHIKGAVYLEAQVSNVHSDVVFDIIFML